MLSKSQARAFFLGGTLFFSAIFIFLTVDTLQQTSARTNSQNLSAEVLKGKEIWEKNNCMGCHTLLGEGAYYAPDLTKVIDRRGKEWIKVFLDDPQAMFPGERKMVKYNFSHEEKEHIISFLEWVGKLDSNGWPPEPNISKSSLNTKNTPSSNDGIKAPDKFSQLCTACHAVGGMGGNVGPALDGVGVKFDRDYLNRWLNDPQSVKSGTNMPKLPLSDAERNGIVDYLSTLK